MRTIATISDFVRLVDHTLLKPEATRSQVEHLCDECLQHAFFAVCVNPVWVPHCVRRLRGSSSAVASVAGFPLGASTTEIKALEARGAVEAGAVEVDMVANLALLLSGEASAARDDIATVVESVRAANRSATVKVILETSALTHDAIVTGCNAALAAGAAFVKTSTGFHPTGGATIEHVALLKRHAGSMQVKASGGIRDLVSARAMVAAGADRLGMSAGVAVLAELERTLAQSR